MDLRAGRGQSCLRFDRPDAHARAPEPEPGSWSSRSACTVEADQNVLAQRVVHLRARVEAGTELRYQWDFGDGSAPQYDDRMVSHVYSTAGTYHRHGVGCPTACTTSRSEARWMSWS